jgi:hypothetical protein
MSYISKQFLDLSQKLGIEVSLLPHNESGALCTKVAQRFGLDKRDLHACTFTSSEYKAICDSNAWRWIGDFVGSSPIFLLIGEGELSETWRVKPGKRVVELLAETTGFVFFVTNNNADYLLCYDDHDCLIGFGTAAAWISGMKVC